MVCHVIWTFANDISIGIKNGQIKVDASVLGDEKDELRLPQNMANMAAGSAGTSAPNAAPAIAAPKPARPQPGENVLIPLNSSDQTFSDIRDVSIEQLGVYLQVGVERGSKICFFCIM